MPSDITVSYVVTVYNKGPYLPATIRSIASQEGSFSAEYVFVDDASTDDSVAVVRRHTQGLGNVRIVTNTENKGPSVRLNQGAKIARGRLLHLVDGDDLLPSNATDILVRILEREDADVIYGAYGELPANAAGPIAAVPEKPLFSIINDPLGHVMARRVSGRCLLTKGQVFKRAGGCDETVFIQDLSLPIRLGVTSRTWICVDAPIVYGVAGVPNRLSHKKAQVFHDWVLSYHGSLRYLGVEAARMKPLVYRQCMSFAWKYVRMTRSTPLLSKQFVRYLLSRLDTGRFVESDIREALHLFADDTSIRRM